MITDEALIDGVPVLITNFSINTTKNITINDIPNVNNSIYEHYGNNSNTIKLSVVLVGEQIKNIDKLSLSLSKKEPIVINIPKYKIINGLIKKYSRKENINTQFIINYDIEVLEINSQKITVQKNYEDAINIKINKIINSQISSIVSKFNKSNLLNNSFRKNEIKKMLVKFIIPGISLVTSKNNINMSKKERTQLLILSEEIKNNINSLDIESIFTNLWNFNKILIKVPNSYIFVKEQIKYKYSTPLTNRLSNLLNTLHSTILFLIYSRLISQTNIIFRKDLTKTIIFYNQLFFEINYESEIFEEISNIKHLVNLKLSKTNDLKRLELIQNNTSKPYIVNVGADNLDIAINNLDNLIVNKQCYERK